MTQKMAKKRDFLSSLEKSIKELSKAPKELDVDSEEKRPRTVRFGDKVHTRAFLKTKPAGEYEEESEQDESMYRGDGILSQSSDEEISEEFNEEEGDFDTESSKDEDDGSEEGDEDEEGDDDDEGEYEDEDEGMGIEFESLSPAEQLRLLMEPIEDEDEENDDSPVEDGDDLDLDEDGDQDNVPEFDEEQSEDDGDNQANLGRPKSTKLKLSLDEGEEEGEEEPKVKSTFEKQQARLRRTIASLEEENISEKPWMLRGEVTAQARPTNSLLEQDIDFEHGLRAAPIITEEVTETLENLIKQRVKDAAWDDVERKVAPKAVPVKKLPELETEKSKKSLSQVYEDEVRASAEGPVNPNFIVDEATKKIHEEITNLFSKICHKLDSLSNFKFNPRSYPLAEIQIKTLKQKAVTPPPPSK